MKKTPAEMKSLGDFIEHQDKLEGTPKPKKTHCTQKRNRNSISSFANVAGVYTTMCEVST